MGSQLDKIAESPKFRPFMKQVAIMAGALLLVALVLKLAGVHYNDALLTVGFGTLAIVAFLLDKIFPTPIKGLDTDSPHLLNIWKFAMKLTGYSLAVALIGLLFVLQHWPGGKTMLYVGVLSLLVCMGSWLYYVIKRNK